MQTQNTPQHGKAQGRVFIFDGKGHRVGSVIGTTLYRTIHERHILSGGALAFDLPSLEGAKAAGAVDVVIHRTDVGVKMRARLDDYFREGFAFDFGYGKQLGLPLARFQTIAGARSENAPAQLVMGI
jgi:hypothetical protein